MLTQVNKKEKAYDIRFFRRIFKNNLFIKKQGKEIKVTTIAKEMECTKPSVNKAIKNLKANELVNYKTYGEITLTEKEKNLLKRFQKHMTLHMCF